MTLPDTFYLLLASPRFDPRPIPAIRVTSRQNSPGTTGDEAELAHVHVVPKKHKN